MYLQLCLVVCVVAVSVSAQMCQNYGQQCFDHSNCCGGCCRSNICVDSTRPCSSRIHDCDFFYCPPGFSCSLYQRPWCPGCSIVPYCRPEHMFPVQAVGQVLTARRSMYIMYSPSVETIPIHSIQYNTYQYNTYNTNTFNMNSINNITRHIVMNTPSQERQQNCDQKPNTEQDDTSIGSNP